MLSYHQKGRLFAFSATFLVSFFPLAYRELGTLHEPFLCVLALFVVSLITATIPVAIKPSRFKIPLKAVFWVVVIGITSVVGNWSYIEALQVLEPAVAATIQRMELIFVAILGAIFFAEKITHAIVFAIILSLAGLFFLQGGDFTINHVRLDAIILTLLSSLSFALMLTFSKFIMRYTGVITMNFYRLLVVTIVLLLTLDMGKLVELSWYAWFLALVCALCGPSGARFLITHSLKYIPMSKALIYTMTAPVLTACWQWLFWGVGLNLAEIIGAGMILFGVLFTLLKRNKVQVLN